MKKFLDKLKNVLTFKKKSSSLEDEHEFVDHHDELDDLDSEFFDEDSPTDPGIKAPAQQERLDLTQELVIDNTEPELSLDFPPQIDEIDEPVEIEDQNEILDIPIPEIYSDEHSTPDIPITRTQEKTSKSLSFDSLESNSIDIDLDDEEDLTDPNFVQMPQPTLLTKVKSFIDKTKTSLFKSDKLNDLESEEHTKQSIKIDDLEEYDDFDDQDLPSKSSLKEKLVGFLPFLKKKESKPKSTPHISEVQEEKASLSLSKMSGLGFFHWLFSVEARPILHKGFLLILWLFLFFNIGKFSGLFLSGTKVKKVTSKSNGAPMEPTSLSRRIFNKLASQDIFKASSEKEEVKEVEIEKDDQDEICLKSNTQSKFKSFYYLFNTIVLKNSKKSVASFQLRSDPELLEIREGQKIDNRFRVDRIGRLRVIGKNLNTNECEYFENEKANKERNKIKTLSKSQSQIAKTKLKAIQGIQNDGNKVKIKRTFLNEQLSNISGLLKQALAIPINNPDGSVAFRITDIEPGSIYSYLNIQNGDTITEINGNKIATQNEVLSLFSKLKTVKKLQLTVKRGGAPQQLDYTFE